MNALARRALAALFPMPTVSTLEAVLTRAALAYVLWYFFPLQMEQTTQPMPVGLAHWFDLTWLSNATSFASYRMCFAAALAWYVSGIALPLSLPVLTLLHILPYTLFNSQAHPHHGYQIMSLTLLGMSVTAIVHALINRAGWLKPTAMMNAWLLLSAQLMIAGAYLISVCSKMILSSGMWLFNSHYVALDFVKTARQNYYSSLDPALQFDPPGVVWLLNHATLARILFDSGVLLETLLILAVGTRRLSLLMGISVIAMHESIRAMMGLTFFTHESMVAIFFINVPYWLTRLFAKTPQLQQAV
jgi:hypothetical protein